jgi:predicted ribosome quality control (RQC) complex YloA/Tae2 family protein
MGPSLLSGSGIHVHQETLKEIVGDLNKLLLGRFLGKIFQLSAFSLALDFGLRDEGYLFISIEPATPRLYLIKRNARELEKGSTSLSPFAQAMRASLGGGNLLSVTKDEEERIVRFSFSVNEDLGDARNCVMVAQLTGRSANLLLLDSAGIVTHAWRPPRGEGQKVGDLYRPPAVQAKAVKAISEPPRLTRGDFPTLSAAADKHYRQLEVEHQFESLAGNLLTRMRREISRRQKLQANLKKDLVAHGNPEEHKRLGDLLLANISGAKRAGNTVSLTDYYTEGAPTIEIEVDENKSLQEAAGESFSRYTKAKRAVAEIGSRLFQLEQDLEELDEKRVKLEEAIAHRDVAALGEFEERKGSPTVARKKQKASLTLPGMRRYRSSDGYEVLVGRTARDNDQLTFRVARPNDLWLHAGDYPGSHVIVRNSSRIEIPHRTIIEAAQLAAKFSQASKDAKVAIHYTRRKFLSKPKGAAAGLVRMSSFKTITVEPGENIERII